MNLRERIQHANRIEDGREIRRLLDFLAVNYATTYADCREIFGRAGIDAERYEELCQLADNAG